MKTLYLIFSTCLITSASLLHAAAIEDTGFPAPLPEWKTPAQLKVWRAETTARTLAKEAADRAAQVKAIANSTTSFGFYTGKPYMAESGSYAFKYREYNPEMARWTTVDPSGFPDGANNRVYSGKPVSGLDPDGLTFTSYSSAGAANGSLSSTVFGSAILDENFLSALVYWNVNSSASGWIIQYVSASETYTLNGATTNRTSTFTEAFQVKNGVVSSNDEFGASGQHFSDLGYSSVSETLTGYAYFDPNYAISPIGSPSLWGSNISISNGLPSLKGTQIPTGNGNPILSNDVGAASHTLTFTWVE